MFTSSDAALAFVLDVIAPEGNGRTGQPTEAQVRAALLRSDLVPEARAVLESQAEQNVPPS